MKHREKKRVKKREELFNQLDDLLTGDFSLSNISSPTENSFNLISKPVPDQSKSKQTRPEQYPISQELDHVHSHQYTAQNQSQLPLKNSQIQQNYPIQQHHHLQQQQNYNQQQQQHQQQQQQHQENDETDSSDSDMSLRKFNRNNSTKSNTTLVSSRTLQSINSVGTEITIPDIAMPEPSAKTAFESREFPERVSSIPSQIFSRQSKDLSSHEVHRQTRLPPPPPDYRLHNHLRNKQHNLLNILDCLQDVQQHELVMLDVQLKQFFDELESSVAYNTYKIDLKFPR